LPGAEDVLIELRASGIPLGLVTDLTAQIQFRKLIHFGIERYFDVVVTSEEAGVEKIGLLPFHLAMDKLEMDRAARVWMIGDAQVDIQQGKQALNCCTFQRCEALSRATIYPEADVVFDSFSDLLTMLQTLGHPPGHPKS
jgi:putative hydrolase of the HAD superfamily